MNELKFQCLCGEEYNEIEFKNHFKKCELYINNFIELDIIICKYLKIYEPLLIRFLLKRYIKKIESQTNKNEKDKRKKNPSQSETKLIISKNINIHLNSQNIINSFPSSDNIIFNSVRKKKKINNINNFEKRKKIGFENELDKNFHKYKLYSIGSSLTEKEQETIINCAKEALNREKGNDKEKNILEIKNYIKEHLKSKLSDNWLISITDNNEQKENNDLNLDTVKSQKYIEFEIKEFMILIQSC